MARVQAASARKASPLLGAHMSIAGGPYRACERGCSIGCDAIQIFTKSPSQWAAGALTEEDARRFREAREECGIRAVIAHDSYLINLASPRVALWKKSVRAFADEMERCRLLGIGHLVTHPGSPGDRGADWGLARVAEAVDAAIDLLPETNRVKVLLETTAGMGASIGHTFEQLAGIRARARRKRRIGYCLDTAHILAAGYEYRTPGAFEETVRRFDDLCGIGNLMAIHLNDSKKDLGARVDRHERIGRGLVGKRALARWIADPRFSGIPVILEVPGGMKAFEEDLGLLRGLVRKNARKS